MVGYYYDTNVVSHGFIYDNGTYTTFVAPGALITSATGINDRGDVVGYYYDSNFNAHGFIAGATGTPAETAVVTLRDLLASQTSQISMNDLVPEASTIGSVSAQGPAGSSLNSNLAAPKLLPGNLDTTIQAMLIGNQ